MIDPTTFPQEFLTATAAREGSNIISPIGRLSFPAFYTPESIDDKPDSEKKYSCSILIPPGATLDLLKVAAGAAATAKWGDKVPEMLAEGRLKRPFLKAEEKKYDGYLPGWTLIRASSQTKPGVRDCADAKFPGALVVVKEEDPEIVYPGRWARISLNAFAYDQKGNKGVAFGLNNVLLMHHDDSLSGRAKPEDEFSAPTGVATASAGAGKGAAIEDMF